jgi:hypothetical protein
MSMFESGGGGVGGGGGGSCPLSYKRRRRVHAHKRTRRRRTCPHTNSSHRLRAGAGRTTATHVQARPHTHTSSAHLYFVENLAARHHAAVRPQNVQLRRGPGRVSGTATGGRGPRAAEGRKAAHARAPVPCAHVRPLPMIECVRTRGRATAVTPAS